MERFCASAGMTLRPFGCAEGKLILSGRFLHCAMLRIASVEMTRMGALRYERAGIISFEC